MAIAEATADLRKSMVEGAAQAEASRARVAGEERRKRNPFGATVVETGEGAAKIRGSLSQTATCYFCKKRSPQVIILGALGKAQP